ncbi:MAG: cytochrome P450 [Acidimicrobiales bacterium]|nr:cytochrome P450 [Acidimicrobiales bacterium]
MTSEHTTDRWGDWPEEVRDDPFPTFSRLVRNGSVYPVTLTDGHDATLVVGHDAARQALNEERLTKDMVAALEEDPDAVAQGLPGPDFAHHMMNADPPDHTRLRRLVSKSFTPRRVNVLEPWITEVTDGLLDDLERRNDVVDLVDGFAKPLPFFVISELLGVPTGERHDLHEAFGTLLSPWSGDPPAEVVAASDAVVSCIERMVDTKAAQPEDDLVTDLVRTSEGGDRLTRKELLSTIFQLVVAGHDTTTSLIGNGVVALLDHPRELERLRRDPALLPAAVEELLRFTAPVPHGTFRYATADVELDGGTAPAGRQVLVCLGAANRDPGHFPDPNQLDLGRDTKGHLAFGHGMHFCLGAPLARLEARVAFARLLDRFAEIDLAVPRDELHWDHGDGLVLRGLSSLPVHLTVDADR